MWFPFPLVIFPHTKHGVKRCYAHFEKHQVIIFKSKRKNALKVSTHII